MRLLEVRFNYKSPDGGGERRGEERRGEERRVKVSREEKTKEQEILYLMLGLLQVPTGPQREPQTMADLRLVLTPSQLLCKPQACQKGRKHGNGSR